MPVISRRWQAAALVAVVTLAHLGLATMLEDLARLGSGSADTAPARIDVAFVRELAPAEPPPVAPVPAPALAPALAVASPPAAAASAPETAAEPATPAPAVAAASAPEAADAAQLATPPGDSTLAALPSTAPVPTADGAASAVAVLGQKPAVPALSPAQQPTDSSGASPPSAPSSASSSAPSFEWPPSTRLSYNLVGNYRGPVQGKARVEWLRSGNRYQVHLDVRVGADFAPLLSRRMSSDGALTDAGLKPQRYDEETKVLLREVRRQTIFFEPERIVLPRGGAQPPVPGVQDTASQFVQLSWMFTLQPQLLRAGQTVELPLALTRRVDRWVYDVVGEEMLDLPVGPVKAWHLKPRLQGNASSDLALETWFAPSLQYLPVRIRIRQDEGSFIDLTLERLPQQASEPAAATASRIVPP
ncbi:MAG: DUF3108 domain-containing protein [Betaproteobacteria bacterium]